ncbi:MAG: NADH-quinone oxidoreductase subunit C [Dehalococcoidia bacterium]|nr:NADH-quinone oxidoreductase subunit C [Dehalococcoidia bacterium]
MTQQEQKLPYPIGTQVPRPELAKTIQRALSNVTMELGETKTDVDIRVTPDQLLALMQGLRDHKDLKFDLLRNISGVDLVETMALKYNLYSFKYGYAVQVTVPTEAGHPVVPSLVNLWPAANWHEREASEMFGFVFDGHPDPRNLLLEEDLHIHPLLKAHPLQKGEIFQGIEDTSAGFNF